MKIKGVNLGNWLVLEKWMSPALFSGTDVNDEEYFVRALPPAEYANRMKTHRDEYITERDFLRISAMGFNTVRIPVPYYIFGDRAPFIGCIEYLDKAFDWAEKYGIKILVDLHTAPEGQNGFDNGGICGVVKWAQIPEEVEFELTVLERLSQRYANRPGLFGVEILNEPITPEFWSFMNIQEKYPPVDKKRAEGTAPIEWSFLEEFYKTAYRRIRKYLPEEKYVVFHDGFNMMHWKGYMQESEFKNVILDTHIYLMGMEERGAEHTLEGYVKFIKETFGTQIKEMSEYFPVVIGEWCLFNQLVAATYKDGKTSLTKEEKDHIYKELAKVQTETWNLGAGYFYWNYKLLVDTLSAPDAEPWEAWDLDRCVNFGWFPL